VIVTQRTHSIGVRFFRATGIKTSLASSTQYLIFIYWECKYEESHMLFSARQCPAAGRVATAFQNMVRLRKVHLMSSSCDGWKLLDGNSDPNSKVYRNKIWWRQLCVSVEVMNGLLSYYWKAEVTPSSTSVIKYDQGTTERNGWRASVWEVLNFWPLTGPKTIDFFQSSKVPHRI